MFTRLLLNYQSSFNRGLTCAAEEALLNGSNPVPDSYFTATSEWPGWTAPMARLGHNLIAWSPSETEIAAIPSTCYLQVIKGHAPLDVIWYFLTCTSTCIIQLRGQNGALTLIHVCGSLFGVCLQYCRFFTG